MAALLTAVLAESLTVLPDAPGPVRNTVGLELLYALGLATRPDPEPDDDNGPWCREVTR
ncbi:hypothetical protein PV703_15610 [Streptomyces sp. ME01-24h]|nr:hypothetical protein [Streptomyces sp. ME01-24h]